MDRIEYFSIIAGEMGEIFTLLGLLTCIPLLVIPVFGEWHLFFAMALVPVIFLLLGRLMVRIHPRTGESRLSIVLAAVALVWFSSAAVGAIPFALGAGMPVTDSLFEAMSGWTCTGLTMIVIPETMPSTLLFWRTFMQWIGGIGMVAFTISILSRSSLTGARFFRLEEESEAFIPNLISIGRQMGPVYLALTGAALAVILLSGVPPWDAVNLAMTAISTGGFSIHAAGISYYQNPLLEYLLVPVMLAGSLPFMIYYFLFRKRQLSPLLHSSQARLLLVLVAAGTLIVGLDLLTITGSELEPAIRHALFMTVSALTTTGFQNVSLQLWASVSMILLMILMTIGGSSGSASGGIKLYRVLLGYRGVIWWLKRIFVSPRILVPFHWEGRDVPNAVAENEVRNNMLVITLYLLTGAVAMIVALHFSTVFFESSTVLFEVVSAMSSGGITTGFVSPQMHEVLKWLFIVLMWAGRLEIVPVIVLAMGLANIAFPDDTGHLAEVPAEKTREKAPAAPAPAAPGEPDESAWVRDLLAGSDVDLRVFEAVFRIAVEISREGREGKPVGTAFIVGDSPEVLARSRQLILNPFEGHPREARMIENPDLSENIKEFALLDGAFVVSGNGIIEAAGRYITIDTSGVRIPKGLGTRHGSVAGITLATQAVGLVVSQSGGRISVFRNGRMVKQFATL
ncbi:MAG: diadenylate cyclase [Methanomicrobiales archaeon]|nr:diadenylate cyclase [Methanomicrobiales archaeon]